MNENSLCLRIISNLANLIAMIIRVTYCLLHLEFQFRGEPDMAQRLWEYNVLATCQNNVPVYSYVLYLKKEGKFVTSPSLRQYPTGEDIHRFQFGVIKLWEIPTAHLKGLGFKGLLPLLPLTREGKDRAIVEEIITELSANRSQPEADLLSLTYGLASLIFRSEEDQNWLKGRFSMLDELLNESWAFQEVLQRGVEKGLQKGLQSSRHTLIALVENHYPALVNLAKEKADTIVDVDALQNLILQVGLAKSEKEVDTLLK